MKIHHQWVKIWKELNIKSTVYESRVSKSHEVWIPTTCGVVMKVVIKSFMTSTLDIFQSCCLQSGYDVLAIGRFASFIFLNSTHISVTYSTKIESKIQIRNSNSPVNWPNTKDRLSVQIKICYWYIASNNSIKADCNLTSWPYTA